LPSITQSAPPRAPWRDRRNSDAAVGDDRDIVLLRRLDRFEQRGELRHADARHNAGGADGARTNADLDRIGAGIDERLGTVGGRDIAGDDLHGIRMPFDAAHLVEHERRMAMGGIDHDQIGAGIDQPFGARKAGIADAGRGRDPETPLLVLAGIRMRSCLLDVLTVMSLGTQSRHRPVTLPA
jgi:hypothetical protein